MLMGLHLRELRYQLCTSVPRLMINYIRCRLAALTAKPAVLGRNVIEFVCEWPPLGVALGTFSRRLNEV